MQTGLIEATAGIFTYFVVMNDYGFKPYTLLNLVTRKGRMPNSGDIYNPNLPDNGNTGTGSNKVFDWNSDDNQTLDLRLFYYDLEPHSFVECRWDENAPNFWRKNVLDNVDI